MRYKKGRMTGNFAIGGTPLWWGCPGYEGGDPCRGADGACERYKCDRGDERLKSKGIDFVTLEEVVNNKRKVNMEFHHMARVLVWY